MERINPDSDTQDEMNWTSASATAGYGTPGYRNSQYGKQDEGEVTGIESPVYSEATKEYTISYHDKEYSLNKVRLGKRDTKGIKPRI